MATLQDAVDVALELLPPVGQKIEFDEFKAKLYADQPDNGRDAFARIIKQDLAVKELSRNADGKIIVLLSRKA